MKEAAARIKINKLLENAGWRFFPDAKGPSNIRLEPSVTLTSTALDDLGDNFERATKGFIDFLLLNEKGFPFVVLEAKAEGKNPLIGKDQARRYAKSQNCRFVILSNFDPQKRDRAFGPQESGSHHERFAWLPAFPRQRRTAIPAWGNAPGTIAQNPMRAESPPHRHAPVALARHRPRHLQHERPPPIHLPGHTPQTPCLSRDRRPQHRL